MKDIFVRKIAIQGIKNLSASCSIQFSPKGRIKAIYGINGSGKTALMLGVRVLQHLLLDDSYLISERRALMDIISKDKKTAHLLVEFEIDKKKYRYETTLIASGVDILISHEKMSSFVSSARASTLFETENGQILEAATPNKRELEQSTANLLRKASLSAILASKKRRGDALANSDAVHASVLALLSLAERISVYLMPGDLPATPYALSTKQGIPPEVMRLLEEISDNNRNKELAFIPKEELDNYIDSTHRLCAFIRLFKPELRTIDVDVREANPSIVSVERIFDYEGGSRIPSYLESTGIRALTSIYPFLFASVNGGIVFIDELDNSINGIFLSALIRYLTRFARGQLCFTSHDSHLMEALEENKYGVSFLSPKEGIRAWVKNGHYDPESQWTGGFIQGFPFNFEPLDFYQVFAPIKEA